MSISDFFKEHKASLSLYGFNLGASVVEIASGNPQLVNVTAPIIGIPAVATFVAEKYHHHKKMKEVGI
jgi:hypothetical protein